jgi:5-methylcytosine-specific restriction endonuclease McrBC regulatory subunit McrC
MITKSHKVFRTFKTQQGWTFWSMLFVMSVILFVAYVGMQLVPLYSANNNVKNAMNLAVDNTDLRSVNRSQIIKAMQAQLYLDGSHQLLNYKTDLKVRRSPKKFVVETHYNREIPLFYNLTLRADFANTVERDFTGR